MDEVPVVPGALGPRVSPRPPKPRTHDFVFFFSREFSSVGFAVRIIPRVSVVNIYFVYCREVIKIGNVTLSAWQTIGAVNRLGAHSCGERFC